MNADLIILPVASERRDAQNERDGVGLRSSVAAATPSVRRSSSSFAAGRQHYNLALKWSSHPLIVASLLEVLPAALRGATRRHLEKERELRAASAPSQ